MPRLAVLISGRGTNLQALLDAHAAGRLAAQPALVVSDVPGAAGLARAAAARVPTQVVAPADHPSRRAWCAALLAALDAHAVDLVALAGFMRILPRAFIARWRGRLVNVHPSLLPAFPGRDAIGQALAAGAPFTGCTVHFVDEGVDTGPAIARRAVPVHRADTPDSLGQRIQTAEHALYARALDAVARGAVRLDGDHAAFADPALRADLLPPLPQAPTP